MGKQLSLHNSAVQDHSIIVIIIMNVYIYFVVVPLSLICEDIGA